jgi:hypothetical protein
MILFGIALCAAGALVEAENDRVTRASLTPFLAALAIETGIFLLRRKQNFLLTSPAED